MSKTQERQESCPSQPAASLGSGGGAGATDYRRLRYGRGTRPHQDLRHGMLAANERRTLNKTHRPKSLLAGLLKCGLCGGGYTLTGLERYGCATRRSKGTCRNSATIGRRELEVRIFDGLKTRLMAPDLVREFMDSFQREANKAAANTSKPWTQAPPACRP